MYAVFGDVHGDAKKLEALITTLKARYPGIELVSVGDLIDRGPDSKRVIDLCIEHKVVACLGNHESWVWSILNGDYPDVSASIWGVMPTLASYGIKVDRIPQEINARRALFQRFRDALPAAHRRYYQGMQLCLRIDEESSGEVYWVTHSGITNSAAQRVIGDLVASGSGDLSDAAVIQAMAYSNPENFFFGYPKIRPNQATTVHAFSVGTQIFGHQVINQPIMGDRYIAIDTGCGTAPPYMLTAVVLPTKEFVRV